MCGHSCVLNCQIIDKEHIDVHKECHKPCKKIVCQEQNKCPKMCHFGQDCGKCEVVVNKVRLSCQHTVAVMCCEDNPSLMKCTVACDKIRKCNHKCESICSNDCEEIPCKQLVKVQSPCGHSSSYIQCSESTRPLQIAKAKSCTIPCNEVLTCGHVCKGSCGQCNMGRLHFG